MDVQTQKLRFTFVLEWVLRIVVEHLDEWEDYHVMIRASLRHLLRRKYEALNCTSNLPTNCPADVLYRVLVLVILLPSLGW